MRIMNLTQHIANTEQRADGVVEPPDKDHVRQLLTFDEIPTLLDMENRAFLLAKIAAESGASAAMIGGAPFFMSTLERALFDAEIRPVYAFSQRLSVEDGGGNKRTRFVYQGLFDEVAR